MTTKARTLRLPADQAETLEAIAAIDGYAVSPSDANFLWVRTRQAAQVVYDGLRARGILVRS